MEQLTNELYAAAEQIKGMHPDAGAARLQAAAKAWAAASLDTFSGNLLKNALKLSAAIADFTSSYITITGTTLPDCDSDDATAA